MNDRPAPGPHLPVVGTPERVPGSVRRTSSIDTTRPDGRGGHAVVDARARDARTSGDGTTAADDVALRLVLDSTNTIVDVEADPPIAGLGGLVGSSVGSGFRRRVREQLPDEAAARSLAHLLLDDLPGAVLVSGYAFLRNGPIPHVARSMPRDLCAGWAADGSMMRVASTTGFVPVPIGPPAPVLERDDDEVSWHPMAPMPVDGMRRRRRLDLLPSATVDVHFRDTYMGPDFEMVLHEYAVVASIDRATRRLGDVEATARVLPWAECPAATASTRGLRGTPLADLDGVVRRDLVGAGSCTHLNDTLRSLADVDALL